MIDKENLEKTAAWPFLEAKKILRERKAYIEFLLKMTFYGNINTIHEGSCH